MRRKTWFLISIQLIFTINVNSQTTFNNSLNIMKYINQAGSVLTYGDTIICIGNGTDHNTYKFYGAFIAKLGLDGNLLQRNVETDGDFTYQENNSSYIYRDRVITAVDVITRDSTGGTWKINFIGGYLMAIDIHTGKIEKKIKFSTPQSDKKWQLVMGFAKIDSVTYAVVSAIDEPNNKYLDSQISIMNIKTEKVKYIQFGRKKVSDTPFTIIWTGDKLLVGSYYSYPDFNPEHPWNKITHHTLLYEVDTSGLVKEVFESDTMRSAANEMMIDENGEYVYLSSFVKYNYNVFKDRYYKRRHYSINKLDKDYNLVWERPCGLKYDFTGYNGKAGKVIFSTEGDGYIAAVSQTNYPWDISWEGKDSMRNRGLSPMMVGILNKFSKSGDELWTRSYSVVNDTSVGRIEHIIKDMSYAPNGGYLIYGEVTNIRKNGDTFALNHAWLFKVDDYGCFVPGCQKDDTTIVNDKIIDLKMSLYPNPVSNRIYIYQPDASLKHYTITDISGRKTNSWSGDLNNHTYIIDVSDYKRGVYVLNVIDNKGRIGSHRFIVN